MLTGILFGLAETLVLLGIGSVLARFLQISPSLGELGILGLIGVAIAGSVVHLLVPISGFVQLTFLAFGIFSAIACRRQIRASLTWPAWVGLIGGFVIAGWTLQSPSLTYDDGLYYLQTIKWIQEFPIVVGLGNLHGRLAYNSQDFIILAAFPTVSEPWVARAILSALLVASLMQQLDVFRHSRIWRPDVFWYAALAPLALVKYVIALSDGPLDPDSLSAALIVYWILIALRMPPGDAGSTTDYALLVVIGTFTATVKLSALPVFAVTLLVVVLAWASGRVHQRRVFGLSAFLVVIWLLRGVLLSGCALYPAEQSCVFALPWAVRPEQVSWHSIALRAWARMPYVFDYHTVLGNWDWFQPWLWRVLPRRILQVGLGGAIACSLAAVKSLRRGSPYLRAFLLAGFLALCFAWWFTAAPDPRFGAGFFISFGLLGFSLLASLALPASLSRRFIPRYAAPVICAMVALAALHAVVAAAPFQSSQPPVVEAYELRSPSMPRVWIPQQGELCWNHALPCAPYIHVDSWRRIRWPRSLPSFPEASFVTPPGWIAYEAEDSRRRPAMRVPPKPSDIEHLPKKTGAP